MSAEYLLAKKIGENFLKDFFSPSFLWYELEMETYKEQLFIFGHYTRTWNGDF